MEFFHPLLAFGAATFAIPVVIHLIFRMRKRRVVFSSLRFLQQSVLKESRRLKLRELILLLLRCAACILIALAFARPYLSSSALAGPNGRAAQDAVIVLDDSPSMNAQEGVSTRWQEALKKAREEIAAHPNGDRVALVLVSDPARAEIELSGNFSAVAGALKGDKPSPKRGDLAQALNTAIEMLATSTQARRRVILFSDFQTNQIDRGAWATLAQKAAAAGHGISVELQGPASSATASVRLANLAITDVRAKSDVWIEGRPVPFLVRVANHGDGELPNVSVKLMVDGKAVATRTLGIGPRSSTEIELNATFPRAGEVWGYAEVDAHDCFPDDDKRLFALRLRDSLKVVVVEEKLSEADAFLDQGYYVRMALDPKARGETESHALAGNYIQVQSVTAAQATAEMYRNADLIVLVGITSMTDAELVMLEDSVRDGHNLIIFAGRSDGRISEPFYNGPFWKGGLGLLPARVGPVYEGNKLEGKYHKIQDYKKEHTLFKLFADTNEADLRLPRFIRHFVTNPADLKIGSEPPAEATTKTPSKEPPRPAGEVLATFSGEGSPFAVERPFGKGNVLMFTFVPRPEATDLPTRKAFVPLLHQAVRHLAGIQSASRRNLLAGDAFDFADAGATPEVSVALEKPGGTKEVLTLTGADHPSADVLGLFTAAFQKGNVQERTLWAVNLDARESELVSEPLNSLRTIFSSTEEKEAPTVGGIPQWTDEQKALAPDWRWYLIAALCCLMLEVAVRDFWKS